MNRLASEGLFLLCVQVCTAKMNLSDEVDLEDYVSRPDKISAAEVGAVNFTLHY
jgi:ATP-dependent 26S proteasome regulatory subunit